MHNNAALLNTLNERYTPEHIILLACNNEYIPHNVINSIKKKYAHLFPKPRPNYRIMPQHYDHAKFPVNALGMINSTYRKYHAALVEWPSEKDSDQSLMEYTNILADRAGLPRDPTVAPYNREDRCARNIPYTRREYRRLQHAMTAWRTSIPHYIHYRTTCNAAIENGAGLYQYIANDTWIHNPISALCAAYIAARGHRRMLFTNGPQSRRWDTLADDLVNMARHAGESLEAIAWVNPRAEVLNDLPESTVRTMMQTWSATMHQHAATLKNLSQDGALLAPLMITCRGMDSTGWNLVAEAYNNARSAWLTCIYRLGLHQYPWFNTTINIPGKCMRVMAADVYYYHQDSGNNIDPDTKLWNALPKPWEPDAKSLTKEKIAQEATRLGVPLKGWVQPVPKGLNIEAPSLTPTTLHGVCIASDAYDILRTIGAYAGPSKQ